MHFRWEAGSIDVDEVARVQNLLRLCTAGSLFRFERRFGPAVGRKPRLSQHLP